MKSDVHFIKVNKSFFSHGLSLLLFLKWDDYPSSGGQELLGLIVSP